MHICVPYSNFTKMKKALIIIATYNEAENITLIIKKILEQNDYSDVLIVDDNSPDGTGNIVEEFSKKNNRVFLIGRKGKLGYGTAFIEGFDFAIEKNYEVVISMDGDFSHNPDDINHFLKSMDNYDLIIGSRYIGGIRVINWPLRRLILSTAANKYIKLITGLPFYDCTSGYRCYKTDILKKMNYKTIKSNGYSFLVELLYKAYKSKGKIKEIPIIFSERSGGKSKMSKKVIFEALFTPIICRLGLIRNSKTK